MTYVLGVMTRYTATSRRFSRLRQRIMVVNLIVKLLSNKYRVGPPRLMDAKIAASEFNREPPPQRQPGRCAWSRTAVQDACYESRAVTECWSSHKG